MDGLIKTLLTRDLGSSLAALVSALTVGVSVVFILMGPDQRLLSQPRSTGDLSLLEKKVEESRKRLLEIERQHTNFTAEVPHDSVVSHQVTSMVEKHLSDIRRRLAVLENVVVDNPERALSIPILKLAVDHLETNTNGNLQRLEQNIEFIYDGALWLVGLIATIGVSTFGVAFSNITRRRDGHPQHEAQSE